MRHGPAHTVTVVSLSILLGGQSALLHAQATFNMDLLEKNDHLPAVDLQRFNQQAGQPPGAYPVSWQVNGVTLDARKTVTFRQNDRGQLTPCLKPEDLLQAGVNPAVLSQAPSATSRSCPELNALLPGSTVNFDFAHQRLVMTIPQALMTHRARDNVPSALWDEGISAFQSNYRYSGASQRTREGSTERDNYLMLKSGVNLGAWRLRASNSLTANSDDKPQWTTSGAWLERDLTRWQSELTLGDTFTSGDVFDAVQFQGISLASSDAMLPDSQKGFAPTIRGFAHNLTLFGGLQSAAQYHNLSLGAGQGLGEAGALSLQLLNARDRHQQDPIDGRAWQLQYSKGFDRLGTQLTFTGWRYSHQRYATLSEAFSSPGSDDDLQDSDNKKATLQITASQSLPYDITLYLSLDQDSYWSGGATQRTANMGISSRVHGIAWSLSYSDSRSSHGDEEDDEPHSDKVVTLSLSVPLSHLLPGSYAGYTLTSSRHSVGSQMVSLNGTLLDNHALSYAVSQTRDRQNGSSGSLTAGYSSGRGDLNLGYSHDSQAARLNYGASGGILIHRHGVVFTPEMNGAVVLIDAGGAGGVTLANQKTIATNGDGYAVLPFATAYHRNDVSLDSHSLPENVDLANSTVTLVPTKDAVVLARFHTHVGYKALFTLQSRGQPLPFGSEVRAKDTNSIVASEGQVYLAGLAPKGTLYAQWGPGPQQRCSARYDLTPTLAQTPHPLILQQTLSCPF
ncbi:fimbrial biogenesis outer membrane usher protein [Klebsiella pneumoniae]|nr:fimbrial biogenesis outer membrane usher protein [Klebsiella pneumoniae]MDZ2684642.1 fimbrial biogenesis outer membrane usher protein [Klebsiella pneumoniae]MDZ2701458.1 fimbrial biogenesis outer membrane usher protein [Klebsiella pneumoniae]MDZ2707077.1 fimbrial biogenesis outer membrane usher protein [Klebsiella pneumoniae]MDZ2807360.1 fimbrial biogenesis outer membrane usher protein [Klebsiella pneumoniae]